MEGLEMEAPLDDFCNSVLSRFSDSTNEDHQHICAVMGAMSQEIRDQNLPCTPVAYFGATCSSLDRISSEPDPSAHLLDALLTILSLLLPKIPTAILNKKKEFLADLVTRVFRISSLTVGALTSGLKCISHLLIITSTVNWSIVCNMYGFILGFIADSRPKVRRQAHICLCEVLLKFRGTSVLSSASEGITNIFEKSLLLAGGSNTKTTEGPKGAQEVLYILDALKDCLPLMSMKCITNVLKYYKTLLELHQPIVTRRITDSLNSLCLHPAVDVSAEVLLDLLCSIASSFRVNETSADGLAFTARLLNVGMQKVFSVNRQICVVKLPVAFNALKDIMLSEHEEAIRAAHDALKNLISACIDEDLIKQGTDQIAMTVNMDARRCGPTVIEKLCVIIESLLDYHYTAVLDLAFQVVSVMFDKLGKHSSCFLRGALNSLTNMQKMPDEDFPFRKELHECLGSALGAMGPEFFLDFISFNLNVENLSEVNVWLFPILKQYTVGAQLSFFTRTILGMIGEIKQKSLKLEQQGLIFSLRSMDALVYSFWSLLPSFCNYPLDTAESFKDLEKALCIALNEEPDVRGIICSSLQILIQQNKRVLEGKNVESDVEVCSARQLAISYYTPQVAKYNLTVLKSSSRELLSVLSGIFMKSTKDGSFLQSTIGEISSISDKNVVSRFFQGTMQKLLKLTREARKREELKVSESMHIDKPTNATSPSFMRAQLFDLAVSFLPGLSSKEIDVLFVAVKSALKEQDCEGLIQKKAYKVLSVILRDFDGFISSKFEELPTLMIEVLHICHFSAKRHRLDCLYFLIVHVSKEDSASRRSDIISSFLTEIILALKEANKKTRNRAYDILVQIGHACMDEDAGGKREHLYQLFNMVAGGLGGETPHMISAAMKGLARLAYEFSDLVSAACNLLPSTFLLLQRKNREIIKANLGFLKVLVAKSKAEMLHMHLTNLVEALLKWQDDTKNHFKAKVKQLLEMLVRKCGLDAVKTVMPEEHMRLLTNIRKTRERKERKLKSEEARSQVSKATTSRMSRWNHTKIFSESWVEDSEDSGAEYLGESDSENVDPGISRPSKVSSQLKSKASKTRPKSRSKMNLLERLSDQLEDEPLDLLDRQRTRYALQSSGNHKRKIIPDDEMKIDNEGRLIISMEENPNKRRSSNPDADGRSEVGSRLSDGSSKKIQKRRRTSESGWAYTGTEYATKKASGDVKRKDKLEPFAYWPLDRKMMSRRPEQQAAARKGMVSVVKMAKKLEGKSASGLLSSKGAKLRKKSHDRGNKKKAK